MDALAFYLGVMVGMVGGVALMCLFFISGEAR
ncbi:MAG: DUF3789 domain-containing protein [Deltaproteobacteria bacterium]|nr:DUF3789 domain-containing protein [Deltaproteobacteria bacterium]